MSNLYKRLPSEIMDIGEPYTAYCFDEACAWLIRQLEDGKEPQFTVAYKSFKDFYAQYER